MDRHFGSAQLFAALAAFLFKMKISDFCHPSVTPLFQGYFSQQFPSLCSVTEIHTTCLTSLFVTLVTPYVSSLVIFCSRAWILKISVLAGGSFWDCIEVIEVLGAKKAESVSCWWIVEHPLVVRSQINRRRWSLVLWWDHLILEWRWIIKLI